MPYSVDASKPSTSLGEPSYLNPTEQKVRTAGQINENIPKRFRFSTVEATDDTIAVIARVKPLDGISQTKYFTYDDKEHSIKVKKNNVEQIYNFTRVLKAGISQKKAYKKCVGSKLQDLLEGKNSFIFTYGASNSGKTFTIHGEKDHPGLIPRLLVSLFSSLENSMDFLSPLIPERATSIMEISQTEMSNRLTYKKKLIGIIKTLMPQINKTEGFIPYTVIQELENEMDALYVDEEDVIYSVWLSFYEIYNEKVYDLFDEPKDKKIPLRVLSDKDRQFYIKDLNYIQVTNLFEAYLLYTYGRYRLSIFSTGVNCKSSRSHSVFTMKIIGRPKDCDMEYFLHSSMSICDLAGTERSNKTGNIGQRLKESNRINTSFLVLNKCLRVIRDNQMSEVKKVIPYRESKLTQILGPSLTSADVNLTMIVTLSQSDVFLDETEGILRSSSVATSIKTISPRRINIAARRFSVLLSDCPRGQRVEWKALASQRNQAEVLYGGILEPENSRKMLEELKTLIPEGLQTDICKQLLEQTKKRVEAEEKLAGIEEKHRKELENLKETLKKEMEESMKTIKEQEDETIALGTEYLRVQKKLRLLTNDYESLKKENDKLQELNEKFEELLEDAREEVNDLQEEDIKKDELLILKDQEIQNLKEEKNDLEEQVQMYIDEIQRLDLRIAYLEEDKEKHVQSLEDLSGIMKVKINDETLSPRGEFKCTQRSKSLDHQSSSSDNDPDFLMPGPCTKARTAVKKRTRTKKQLPEYIEALENEPEASSSKTKKKLFQRTSCEFDKSDLTRNEDGLDQTQASPGTIIKRQLRPRKK